MDSSRGRHPVSFSGLFMVMYEHGHPYTHIHTLTGQESLSLHSQRLHAIVWVKINKKGEKPLLLWNWA